MFAILFKFLGGAQEVGRSAIMLKDETSVLLDYGIKLNHKIEYPAAMPNVDGLVLSHAHLDHSGGVPTLYNEMLIPSFGTEPTLKLSELLLIDALSVARKEHMPQKYHKRQISTYMHRYMTLDYGSSATLGNFEIQLYDAGHICGSAVTLIERKNSKDNRRIVYTGDFKLEPQTLHKGATVVKSDALIIESTYATKNHPDRSTLVKELVAKIRETLDNKGNVLLPVFAVGRSQEMLALLNANSLTQYTYVDGMARSATNIVLNCPDFMSNPHLLEKAVHESTSIKSGHDKFDALNEPSIILTTAGMLSGGPVLDYITKLRKNSQIILTGYQVEGSNGRSLLDNGVVSIHGKPTRIVTPVSYYDLSAHAGMDDLHRYIKESGPNTVICIHGDRVNAIALAESLKLEGYTAHAPELNEAIKID